MPTLTFDTVLPAPLPAARRAVGNRQEDQIASAVLSAISALEAAPRVVERRREPRHPYPYPIHLTPLDAGGQPDPDHTFVVIGRHLAPHGLDFYSRQPLADRRVIASLDCGREGWIGLLLELNWCRFSRHGWYENGGRFLSAVRSPLLDLNNKPRAA
jgi:hypothetical protein